jgi:hypothetical protein
VADVIRKHAEQILFWVTIWVSENAIGHAHGKRSDIAGRNHDLDSKVEGGDECSLRATTAATRDANAFGINIRTGEQVVDRSDAIPDFPASKIGAGKVGKIAENGVLATNEVVTAAVSLNVPELTSFPLTDRVPGNRQVTPFGESRAKGLVMDLPIGGVSCGDEHGGMTRRAVIRNIYQRGDINAWKAFEDEFLDRETVTLNRASGAGMKVCLLSWQTANHLKERLTEFALQSEQILLGSQSFPFVFTRFV